MNAMRRNVKEANLNAPIELTGEISPNEILNLGTGIYIISKEAKLREFPKFLQNTCFAVQVVISNLEDNEGMMTVFTDYSYNLLRFHSMGNEWFQLKGEIINSEDIIM